jgi:hypothetical protein
MHGMTDETHLKLSGFVQFEQDEEASDAVLVDTNSGEIFSCNASATDVVKEMVAGSSKSTLTHLLMQRYSLDRATAERDIQALVETMAARGFLAGCSGPVRCAE